MCLMAHLYVFDGTHLWHVSDNLDIALTFIDPFLRGAGLNELSDK